MAPVGIQYGRAALEEWLVEWCGSCRKGLVLRSVLVSDSAVTVALGGWGSLRAESALYVRDRRRELPAVVRHAMTFLAGL